MTLRLWIVGCSLAAALVVMSGLTLGQPPLTPVPLVSPLRTAPPKLLATWAQIQSYVGTYSGDIEVSSHESWSEHFAGSVTITPICANCSNNPRINFMGRAQTNQSAEGFCGTAESIEPTSVVLAVDVTPHTYALDFIPNPGTVQLKGGDSSCTHPFTTAFPVAQFSRTHVPLLAPANGICGSTVIYRTIAGGSETDKISWRFRPVTDAHWTIAWSCPSFIDGVAPL